MAELQALGAAEDEAEEEKKAENEPEPEAEEPMQEDYDIATPGAQSTLLGYQKKKRLDSCQDMKSGHLIFPE